MTTAIEGVSNRLPTGVTGSVAPTPPVLTPEQIRDIVTQTVAEVEAKYRYANNDFKHQTALHIISAAIAASVDIPLVTEGAETALIEATLGGMIKLAKSLYNWERVKRETE